MTIVNKNGVSWSYECEDLIAKLKEDIKEFGKDCEFIAWYIEREDIRLYTNYDFDDSNVPVSLDELNEGEHLTRIKGWILLEHLIKQNEVF